MEKNSPNDNDNTVAESDKGDESRYQRLLSLTKLPLELFVRVFGGSGNDDSSSSGVPTNAAGTAAAINNNNTKDGTIFDNHKKRSVAYPKEAPDVKKQRRGILPRGTTMTHEDSSAPRTGPLCHGNVRGDVDAGAAGDGTGPDESVMDRAGRSADVGVGQPEKDRSTGDHGELDPLPASSSDVARVSLEEVEHRDQPSIFDAHRQVGMQEDALEEADRNVGAPRRRRHPRRGRRDAGLTEEEVPDAEPGNGPPTSDSAGDDEGVTRPGTENSHGVPFSPPALNVQPRPRSVVDAENQEFVQSSFEGDVSSRGALLTCRFCQAQVVGSKTPSLMIDHAVTAACLVRRYELNDDLGMGKSGAADEVVPDGDADRDHGGSPPGRPRRRRGPISRPFRGHPYPPAAAAVASYWKRHFDGPSPPAAAAAASAAAADAAALPTFACRHCRGQVDGSHSLSHRLSRHLVQCVGVKPLIQDLEEVLRTVGFVKGGKRAERTSG